MEKLFWGFGAVLRPDALPDVNQPLIASYDKRKDTAGLFYAQPAGLTWNRKR